MNYGFLAALIFSVSHFRQFSCLICTAEQKGAVGRDLGRCERPMAMEIDVGSSTSDAVIPNCPFQFPLVASASSHFIGLIRYTPA